MTPEQLREMLAAVASRAASMGMLPDDAVAGPPSGPLFRPVDARTAGVIADWVTPVAQRWGAQLGLEPRDLARVLAQGFTDQPAVAAVEVTPAGLIAITLDDLVRCRIIDTVFADRDAYALGERRVEVSPTDAALPESDPLHRAQLAYARLRRIIRNAEAVGVSPRPPGHGECLTHVSERLLLVWLADLPQRLAAHDGDRRQQVRALTDLAAVDDAWDHPVRPVRDDLEIEPIHGVRLSLAEAAAIVLRNGLARLGARAPERM